MGRGLIFATLLMCVAGCVYKGAKVVEGTDLAIGLNIPGSDGALQLQLFNYLSGFRLGVAKNARLTVDYTVAETNSFMGIATTQITKTIKATVDPLEEKTEDIANPEK